MWIADVVSTVIERNHGNSYLFSIGPVLGLILISKYLNNPVGFHRLYRPTFFCCDCVLCRIFHNMYYANFVSNGERCPPAAIEYSSFVAEGLAFLWGDSRRCRCRQGRLVDSAHETLPRHRTPD
jgi:hypothetical protein